ncbi:hypothetical protein IT401_01655 [Candidatus Nomurabacteria bacterium]|nr:hypothetical protein [Candidatus Nomurabacteria bacterium]
MAKSHISVGIDIGSSFTRIVVVDNSSNKGVLPVVLGAGIVETRGMRHGYVVHRNEVTASLKRAIAEAEKESGQRIRSAAVSLGGIGISCESALGSAVVSRADSVVSKFDIDKAIAEAEEQIELKNKAVLHAFPSHFKVDGKGFPARPEGMVGGKIEAKTLFITALEQHLDDLLSAINEAGVKVTSFTATPIAAASLLLTDLQKNFGCALIDIGAETVSLAVIENNVYSALHVFGIGSLDITKDIALGLRITPEEAESLKLGVVGFQTVSKKKLDEIIEARLSEIFEIIDKYLKKIGRSGLLPAGAIIIGEGSALPLTEQVAKTILKIPVKMGSIDLPGAKGTLKQQTHLIHAYAVAADILGHSSQKRTDTHLANEGEGFFGVIKNLIKQLMP